MKDYIEVRPGDISTNPELTGLLVDVVGKRVMGFEEAGRETGNDSVLAGGAVRDILLGYKPKDLDVFITGVTGNLDDENVYFTEVLRRQNEEEYETPFREKGAGRYADGPLVVYRYRYGAYPIDVMTTSKSLEETLDSFDHDLVKCYMKGGKYFVSPDFLEVIRRKRVPSRDYNARTRLTNWKRRTGSTIQVGRPPKIEGLPF